jgi:uncharacterized protein (TIGR03118 family)
MALMMLAMALPGQGRSENKFLQHNLVSDLAGIADVVDPSLLNPWGISASPTSPFWISNNHSGTAKIYDSSGKPGSLIVTLHAPGGTNPSTPTGQVFNSTSAFVLPGGKPAVFIFATEDGTISGWFNGIENNEAVTTVNSPGAIYKGLAISDSDSGPVLYAADFHGGSVDVYGGDFSRKTLEGAFADPQLPAGFAPFNVYSSSGKVYVAYARQDDDKHDDVPGDGNGFIDVFDPNGRLLQRLISGGRLNSPWGMVIAPDGFGDFGKALLVGNFGDGTINAYDPATGAYLGTLQDASGKPIVNSGLWGLQFGNGGSGGDVNALYFAAGISGPSGDAIESHGLFGSIQAAPAIQSNGVVNGAGFQPVISPNSWVTIFGKNLAATTRSWADSDFVNNQLPVKLDGVTATIDGKPAYVAYVSPKQLNVLAPAAAATGSVKVELKSGDLTSASMMAQMEAAAPAFFKNEKYAIATHVDGKSLVDTKTPAESGELIVLYGTGFGATNPPVSDGQLVNSPLALANPVTVLIGGIQAQVMFAGLIGPGLYQLNVKVPEGVSSGDAAIVAETGGIHSPEGIFLAARAAQPVVAPPPAPVYSADINNFQFVPSSIDVNAGGILTWTNKQNVEHTVVSNDAKFGSVVLSQNDTFSFKFTTPGAYAYHCSIHPSMKGTVVVK